MEMDIEKMIEEISSKTGKSKEEIEEMIEEKMKEFGGLISKTGILLIIGKEFGIDLIKPKEKNLKVENLVDGLSRVNIILKIIKIISRTEFERKNGEKGKVLTFLGGDETGVVKVSIWNEKVDEFENENIKEGDVVELKNAYTRLNDFGNVELRLGTFGSVKKSDEIVNVDESAIETSEIKNHEYVAVKLNEVKENMHVEISGVITAIFEKQIIYYFCPICKEKLEENETRCKIHGEIEPTKLMIINGYIDDGYGRIRYVLFRRNAEKFVNKSTDSVDSEIKIKGNKEVLEDIKSHCIGKYITFQGIIKKNNVTDSLELVVNNLRIPEINENEIKSDLRKIKIMLNE